MLGLVGRLKSWGLRFEEKKTLEGFVSICSCCEKIQDSEDSWLLPADAHVALSSDAVLTHGLCPSCYEEQRTEFRRLSAHRNSNAERTSFNCF